MLEKFLICLLAFNRFSFHRIILLAPSPLLLEIKFSCGFNNIKGNIPNEFGRLSELQILYAGSNQLAGRFSQAILNLSTLVSLALNTNNLSGVLPFDLGSSLPNLQLLTIAINFFHGHIPS